MSNVNVRCVGQFAGIGGWKIVHPFGKSGRAMGGKCRRRHVCWRPRATDPKYPSGLAGRHSSLLHLARARLAARNTTVQKYK